MSTFTIALLSIAALVLSLWLSWRVKSAPDYLRVRVMALFGALLVAIGIGVLLLGGPVFIVIVAAFALVGRGIGYFAADRWRGAGPRRS